MFQHRYGLSVNFKFNSVLQKLHKFVVTTTVQVRRILYDDAADFFPKLQLLKRHISPNFLPAGRRGPLASRGPYARADRAYRLMRP